MNLEILKLKHITPIEKLILVLIERWPTTVMAFPFTSQEIANDLGLKRKEVLDALSSLEERDYITCEIEYRSRKTTITKRFKDLINKD